MLGNLLHETRPQKRWSCTTNGIGKQRDPDRQNHKHRSKLAALPPTTVTTDGWLCWFSYTLFLADFTLCDRYNYLYCIRNFPKSCNYDRLLLKLSVSELCLHNWRLRSEHVLKPPGRGLSSLVLTTISFKFLGRLKVSLDEMVLRIFPGSWRLVAEGRMRVGRPFGTSLKV
jgi:hypothetical protein